MTDHEQLIELEPLLRELGWWPEEIILSMVWCSEVQTGCLYDFNEALASGSSPYTTSKSPIEWEHALAIVTDRAEKELVKRGWSFMKPGDVSDVSWEEPESPGGDYSSLADALRVEINRQNNEEAREHEAPYK